MHYIMITVDMIIIRTVVKKMGSICNLAHKKVFIQGLKRIC